MATVDGIVTVVSELQSLNADATMLLPDTIVSCARLKQLKYPVEAKAAGTLREAGLTRKKASAPIEVTDDGTANVTEDMAVQLWKALLPIAVTDDGIATEVSEVQL